MNERVVHCQKEPYDVYIGRPSKWGNPFSIGKDGNRKQVIEKFRRWIYTSNDAKELRKQLPELEGKVLGCWCAPKSCHGDVYVEILNNLQG